MKSSGEKVGRLTFLQTRLQTWREEELNRWKVIPAEMSDEEIEKEVEASVERIRDLFCQQQEFEPKDEYSDTSDEDIWNEVEDSELQRSTSERIRRLLIGEDLKGMSKQLDEIFEKNAKAMDDFVAIRLKDYNEKLASLEEREEAIDGSKSSANIEKLRCEIVKKLEEIKYDSLRSSLRKEDTLKRGNHINLKGQLLSISVLREMKKNLEEVRKNTSTWRQFGLVVAASAVVAISFGFVVDVILLGWKTEIKEHWLLAILLAIGVVGVIAIGVFAGLKIRKRVKKKRR